MATCVQVLPQHVQPFCGLNMHHIAWFFAEFGSTLLNTRCNPGLTCFSLLSHASWLQRKLKALIGNYTFLEAYERTGRILNVSVCPADTNEPARLLNYLTAPQVGGVDTEESLAGGHGGP